MTRPPTPSSAAIAPGAAARNASEGAGRLATGRLGLRRWLFGQDRQVLDEVMGAEDRTAVAQLDDGHAAQGEREHPEPLDRQVEQRQHDELEDAVMADHEAPWGVR